MEENRYNQEFIKKKLNDVRHLLNEKEKEFVRASNHNLENNQQILNNQSISSGKILENINLTKKNIELTLKKEQLTILQEFNHRDEQTQEILGLAERDKQKIKDEQVGNPIQQLYLKQFE